MKYVVGKPYVTGFWIFGAGQFYKVHYWSQVSMLDDGPSDCEWIVPGTIMENE